ncbi:unnamed protein product [Adineta steineri]|uniref:HAT C-terminal dimerisation domain-containing protein n=1 Tax=Adineta steineri TaxID=433720 RepID=A0A815EGI2_9BILA|nr:unnamed protein product [Adineta steineri]
MNTYLYNRISGSKRFKQHANKYFPLEPATTSSSITFSSSKQTTLNNMGFTKGVKTTEGDVAKIKDLSALQKYLKFYGINSLPDVNIVCERGSNLVCVFKRFQPIFCYGHRLNNVVKIGFFQTEKRKIKVTAGCATDKPNTEETTIAASIKNENHESSHDDECDHAIALPIIKQKKFHSRKTSITTNELSVSLCYKYIREQLKIIRNAQSTSEILQQTADLHPKKFKTADSICTRFEDDYSHGFRENNAECFEYKSDTYEFSRKQSDELDRYLVMQIDKLSVTDNPLDFWKSYTNQYPLLSKLAKYIYSILTTSTSVERQFSSADLIINQRRTNINPKQVNNIFLIQSLQKQ